MKKIISLIFVLVVCFLISGCGKNMNAVTINCKGETRGENPTIVNYEKYVVKHNKIVEFEKYNILSYTDDYLKKVNLEQIIGVYEKDKDYVVEKVDSNTIKNTYVKPVNTFEGINSDDMVELIRTTMEENPFGLYSYTCEIE